MFAAKALGSLVSFAPLRPRLSVMLNLPRSLSGLHRTPETNVTLPATSLAGAQ